MKNNNEANTEKQEVIPSGVVNIDAYKKMRSLENSKIFKEDIRIIQTSDDDLKIDLFMNESSVKTKTAHLPEEEQKNILRKIRSINMFRWKINKLKAKAYVMRPTSPHPSITNIVIRERASELLEYFGKFYTVDEVHRIVNEQWGMRIGKNSLQKFKKKHLELIKKTQDEYAKDHKNIRLTYKKARLEELTFLYQTIKDRYALTDTREDYKLMLQTLKLIGDMVDGKEVKVAGEITQKTVSTVNYHVLNEIMKGLTLNDIVIARVAARNGVNPKFLSARLHQSIYAQHSGFANPTGDLGEQEITYPSSMVYNWDELKKLHKKKAEQDAKDIKYEELSEAKAKDLEEVKKKLLARVRQKREELREAIVRVDTTRVDP